MALALAAAVIAAPAAAAAQPRMAQADLSAASLALAGSSRQDGLGQFLFLGDDGPNTSSPVFTIDGAHIVTVATTDEGLVILSPPINGQTYGVRTAGFMRSFEDATGTAAAPERHETDSGRIAFTSWQPGFIVNVYATNGALLQTAHIGAADVGTLQVPQLTATGLRERVNPAPSSNSPGAEPTTFAQPYSSSPLVVVQPTGPLNVTLDGDFIVEVIGLSGHASGADGSWDVASGVWQDPVAPGQPASTQGNAYSGRQTFLQVRVTGGHLNLEATKLRAQWAGRDYATTTRAGTAQLQDVTGSVTLDDGSIVAVSAATYDLPVPSEMRTSPRASGMGVAANRLGDDGKPVPYGSTAVRPADSLLLAFLAGAAVLALGLGASFLAFRRWSRPPLMADVEAALEGGQYRRAAADAARILRRKPGAEDATISRAVALSKAGKPRLVVRELRGHIATRRPTDGVIHYVLGSALHDLGRTTEARAAFDEAVRRTPTLLTDVQQKLGVAGAPSRTPAPLSQPEPRDSHGYA